MGENGEDKLKCTQRGGLKVGSLFFLMREGWKEGKSGGRKESWKDGRKEGRKDERKRGKNKEVGTEG